ncbi:hypothetical protein LY78DRAFT_486440 [Colletotrichum sublineola]|nr:hypothetical protein LY78DRAFT_486440 [Colletotrichum sublineola]
MARLQRFHAAPIDTTLHVSLNSYLRLYLLIFAAGKVCLAPTTTAKTCLALPVVCTHTSVGQKKKGALVSNSKAPSRPVRPVTNRFSQCGRPLSEFLLCLPTTGRVDVRRVCGNVAKQRVRSIHGLHCLLVVSIQLRLKTLGASAFTPLTLHCPRPRPLSLTPWHAGPTLPVPHRTAWRTTLLLEPPYDPSAPSQVPSRRHPPISQLRSTKDRPSVQGSSSKQSMEVHMQSTDTNLEHPKSRRSSPIKGACKASRHCCCRSPALCRSRSNQFEPQTRPRTCAICSGSLPSQTRQ